MENMSMTRLMRGLYAKLIVDGQQFSGLHYINYKTATVF